MVTGSQSSTVRPETSLYPWCVNLTSFGELLIWSAPAVEWLRRHCRIVGRASLSTNQTAKNAGSSSVPTQLPVRLSIEELIILLHEGIVHGLRRTRPISATVTPTDEQLEVFHNSLSRNSEEMQEILLVKRRINATGFYSQLINGLEVRRKRQVSRAAHTVDNDDTSSGCSVRQRRRALREQKKRRKLDDCSERLNPTTETLSEEEKKECFEQLVNVDDVSEQPTVDNLLRRYAIGRMEPLFNPDVACPAEQNWRSCVPQHLPRATPEQWERADEASLIPLPVEVKSHGLIAILKWTISVMKSNKSDSASGTPPESSIWNLDVRQLIRCLVFADLWSKGVFITTSSMKMGGDFLVYPGDPLVYHASHVVLTALPEEPLSARQLAARMRLTNSVRKSLVLATVPSVVQHLGNEQKELKESSFQVLYITIRWTNWINRL
ncbi:tRNA-splicing endonuclease subunit Sen34 [Fasciolopsis buskii]|uniref:tRNA-intron lyase n=1 Tax=Fasciolopsis buskii TaxID=27845 RepID=A0A8E0VGH2_9TREM|nr:tRNA-splicing endonuclease subunit Sen34 [Fasciolopsis buski]